MRKNKGITLISLAITILVIMVLTSVATYSGINAINMSKLTAFTTELKIMQTQINSIYQKYKENDIIELNNQLYYGQDKEETDDVKTILEIGEELDLTQKAILNELARDTETGIESADGYRYWSKDLISTLKIEGIRQDFYVNVAERSIVSCQGLKYKDKMYYTLNQLPESMYNVKYDNPNTAGPTFECSAKKIGSNKWEITVSNIQYDGYIDKWDVQYKLEGKDYWNTSKDLSFVVDSTGNYTIRLIKDSIVSADVPLVIAIGAGERVTVKNEQYTDKDGDIAVIPVGFTIVPGCDDVSEGLVISDNEGDTEADPNHIVAQGNQFVWVPCAINESKELVTYKKDTRFDEYQLDYSNFSWDDEANIEENKQSVNTYGGFYVARYEAGIPENANFYPSEKNNYKYYTDTMIDGITKNTDKYKPVSKKGYPSWNYIDYNNAKKVSENMYIENKSIKSQLIDSYAWDTVANWIDEDNHRISNEMGCINRKL